MILGQSAGVAAVVAINGGTSVQDVNYGKLKAELLKRQQVVNIRYGGETKLKRLKRETSL